MSMMDFRPPLTLRGRHIRLVPLALDQIPALVAAGQDAEVWQWMPYGYRGTQDRMADLVRLLLERQAAGLDLALTTILEPGGRPVGMTRYLGIDRPNRNVEVGGTWLDPRLWRTPINTDSKLLMLRHAFEDEGCERVQLKTDTRNVRSQRAIERLGAVREGVWRQHMVRDDGSFRDSVVYSILRTEWPAVRSRLESSLNVPWVPPQGG